SARACLETARRTGAKTKSSSWRGGLRKGRKATTRNEQISGGVGADARAGGIGVRAAARRRGRGRGEASARSARRLRALRAAMLEVPFARASARQRNRRRRILETLRRAHAAAAG